MSVKSILFRVELKGQGIVNFDSSDQKLMFNKLKRGYQSHDNVNYAKKNFYMDLDGNYEGRIKISSNCLRHLIFHESQMFHATSLMHTPDLLMYAIASPCALLRGYLYAKKLETIKRKSPITITDAEQVSDNKTTMPQIEVCAKSGEKDTDKNKTKSDPIYFFKETVGDIKYQAVGAIDLMELQFISCSTMFDRLAFNSDDFAKYKDALAERIPNLDCNMGFYQINNSDINIPEYGVKLSQENVNFLVRDFFNRLLNVNLKRANSYVEMSKVEYKIVENPLSDKMSDANGWIQLTDIAKFPEINFQERYNLIPDKMAESIQAEIKKNNEAAKKLDVEKNDEKKLEKQKAKEAKANINKQAE